MQTAVFIFYFVPGPSSLRSPANSGELRRTRRSLGGGGHPRHLSRLAPSLAALVATTVRLVSRPKPLEEQRRVGSAEAERVRQRVLDGEVALRVRHVVEIAVGVGMIEVDGRRRHLI